MPTLTAAVARQPPTPVADDLNPDQRRALGAARQRTLEGDYPRAIDAWRELLAAGLPPSGSGEARFNLALVYVRARRGTDALQALQTTSSQPDSREEYIRGLALDASNRHAEAMASMSAYAQANPSVAAAIWLEIAERELPARRPREAADATSKGLDAAQARQLKQRLLEVRAQALAALGDHEAAFDAHRQVLALATSNATLGEQLFRLAEVSRDLGKREEAIRALKTALDQFPGASTTADALRLLDELGAADEVDPFVLGRARYFAVDYRNAVSAFDKYLQLDPNGPDVPLARLYRGLASLTPGNEPNALRELDAIADDPNQESEIAAQALVEAGQALEGLSESDQAEVRYERLLQRFPRLDAAAVAGFRLGLARYVRGADSDALAAWDALLARRDDLTPDDVARVLYWRAKPLTRLGRTTEVRTSLDQATAVRPASYYSLRAAQLLGTPAAADTDLAAWMRGRNLDLGSAATTVANDPALARARTLSSLGLVREGNWEVDEVLQRYPDRADRLYVLAQRFADLGLAGAATRLGQTALTAAGIESPNDAPAALRQVAYPRPFADLTQQTAERYGLDALLLETTLRDASQFDTFAADAASGTRGLARMTPIHAEEATRGIGRALDPFRPQDSIEQQAWLVADRLRRFDGRPEVALTTIATTERIVDGWLARPGADDPDVFLEHIDFAGVRSAVLETLATRLAYGMTDARPGPDPLAAQPVKPEPTAAWIKIARLAGDVPPAAPVAPVAIVGSPDQQQAFSRAAVLQRDGDHAAAAQLYQSLVAAPDAAVAAAARLRLGQALLGAGRAVDALDVLQTADAAEPGSVASFLLGRALATMGRCEDALPAFQRFVDANRGTLVAHGQAAQATCLQQLGRAADAVPLLAQAASNTALPRLQTIDVRERLALARLRAGDTDGAAADYRTLLSSARSDSYRAELEYELGIVSGDVGHLRASVQLDPKTRAAQAALDELVSIGDPLARSFEAAETRFEQDRYREALAAYSAFMDANPSDRRVPKAYYGRGVSLVRLNQDRAGIAVLESIGQHFPNTLDAADGMFRGGRIRESLADLDGAAESYRAVMAQPGAGSRATDAQFRLAFVRFQQGRPAEAAAGWRDLTSRVTAPDDRAQAWFWLGKALRASDDLTGASAALVSARDADPRGFYGMRADDLLSGRDDPRAAVDRTLPLVERHADDDPSVELRAWAATRGDVATASARVTGDPGLARAEALLSMGLRREAIWEIGGVSDRIDNDVAGLAILGGWEQQHGLYNAALLLGYDLASAARVSLVSGPAPVRKLLYPLPHPAVLSRVAGPLHTDPLLFSGLMLQESLMDQDVESAAQARGLSQMIASTAYEAARALGVYDFRTSDLFHPNTSIQLGAYTFGRRLARYENRIFPAVAAYNASQFSVDGWLLSAGQADVDTFAEAIPFTETYPYVQRIYTNYRQYLELYGNQ
ncbi:MAG TPA: tetratricopeptide repeat protein [Chloroflexota bacterium]